jgi:hypothetical protein
MGLNNRTALTDSKAKTNAVKVWGKVKAVTSTTITMSDGYDSDVTVVINGVAVPSGLDSTKTIVVEGVLAQDDTLGLVVYAQNITAF